MDALLQGEVHSVACGDESPGSRSMLNAVWRQKVIHWYFTIIAALERQHTASSAVDSPFNRASVHVTASLLDNYLMSLPSERALRYKHDRPAYQLLATTCLLLGMRLAQHDQIKESRKRAASSAGSSNATEEHQGSGLKRAKTHRMNMNEASATTGGVNMTPKTPSPPPPAATSSTAIPNAATLLRISAAPKSISEQHVLSMVREMTGSRAFPRSRVVTALDFIEALAVSSGTQARNEEDEEVMTTLGPEVAEDACRLVDASLRSARFLGCRPSVVACAAITLALARSSSVDIDLTSLRQQVCLAIFGAESDPEIQFAVRKAESTFLAMQVGVTSSRSNARQVVPTTHLIPLEDD